MANDLPTYVVLLTPAGRGAVATVSVAGPQAVRCVTECFRPAAAGKSFDQFPNGRIVFGRWGDAGGEELVCCRLSAERVELHCHGGRIAAGRILDDLRRLGCQETVWDDWLAEHEPDAIAVEARWAIAHARTERTASILLDQLQGALQREIAQIAAHLSGPGSQAAVDGLRKLVARSPLGLHLTQPWKVVLAGRPNVGKSSLINALLGYGRSIVFDAPGTTRDVVTATTAIDGWPVELADTAGLRTSRDPLEAEGIHRATQHIGVADCLLLVFDCGRAWTAEDDALVAAWPSAIVVHNKADLASPSVGARPAGLRTSALARQGIDELAQAIAARLAPEAPLPGAAVPFTPRQVECLQRALDAAAQGQEILAKHFLDICSRQLNTLGSAAGHDHVPGQPG